MEPNLLTAMEIDAIGEILNISLGSAATAISTMLNTRVDITLPKVSVKVKDDFEFKQLEPAVGVEIGYSEGLTGSNIMVLKLSDVGIIVSMLMGKEEVDEIFELDEISMSAIGEVMNQMMGASSTAMAEMLSRTIDISTPKVFEIEDTEEFKKKYFPSDDAMVEVNFMLSIGDKMQSEFINVLPIELVKDMVNGFFGDEGMPQQEVSKAPQVQATEVQQAQATEEVQPTQETQTPQEITPNPVVEQVVTQIAQPQMTTPVPVQAPVTVSNPDQLTQTLQQMTQLLEKQIMLSQMNTQRDPKQIQAQQPIKTNLAMQGVSSGKEENMGLVMGVPVEVSVEIGRTKRLVKDILELNTGSLVVLDKLAGEQVDLLVNGQCIAKGDVVVVDDSFGIRVTEIIKKEIEL